MVLSCSAGLKWSVLGAGELKEGVCSVVGLLKLLSVLMVSSSCSPSVSRTQESSEGVAATSSAEQNSRERLRHVRFPSLPCSSRLTLRKSLLSCTALFLFCTSALLWTEKSLYVRRRTNKLRTSYQVLNTVLQTPMCRFTKHTFDLSSRDFTYDEFRNSLSLLFSSWSLASSSSFCINVSWSW